MRNYQLLKTLLVHLSTKNKGERCYREARGEELDTELFMWYRIWYLLHMSAIHCCLFQLNCTCKFMNSYNILYMYNCKMHTHACIHTHTQTHTQTHTHTHTCTHNTHACTHTHARTHAHTHTTHTHISVSY